MGGSNGRDAGAVEGGGLLVNLFSHFAVKQEKGQEMKGQEERGRRGVEFLLEPSPKSGVLSSAGFFPT